MVSDYKCAACGKVEEFITKGEKEVIRICSSCNNKEVFERDTKPQFGGGFILRGHGFYKPSQVNG